MKPEEISAMKTERIEPHMTTCVEAFQDADGDAKGFHHESQEFQELDNARGSIHCQRLESVQHSWSNVSLDHEGSKIKQQRISS